jgi:hypothetical protein
MRLKNTPIQRKLMSVILLTSAVVLILMCSAYMIIGYYSYRGILKSHITTVGEVVANNSTAALAFESEKDAREILQALRAEKEIVAACLYDKNNKLFAQYPPDSTALAYPVIPGIEG